MNLEETKRAWSAFLKSFDWETFIRSTTPRKTGCGLIYELKNYLERPNETFAIADMRKISFSEPHYHPQEQFEIYFVLQGKALSVVGNKEKWVLKGDVLVTPPEKAHYMIPDKDFVIGVVNLPPHRPENYLKLDQENPAVEFNFNRFVQLSFPIKIREVDREIELARPIFTSYFSDLYKNISPEVLGIKDLNSYLDKIFEKNKKGLQEKQMRGFLAFLKDRAVGFMACGELEDPSLVLIRTLPIDLDHKQWEKEIREAFLIHLYQTFPAAQKTAMMVRKANTWQTALCIQERFKKDSSLFYRSSYIKDTYDPSYYDAFVHCRDDFNR